MPRSGQELEDRDEGRLQRGRHHLHHRQRQRRESDLHDGLEKSV